MSNGTNVRVELSETARHRIQVLSESAVILAALATIPIVIVEETGASALWLVVAEWLIRAARHSAKIGRIESALKESSEPQRIEGQKRSSVKTGGH